jgi:hypothetical protein
MLPTTVSASFAFMLPVATPPNAIVFSYGKVRIKDMVGIKRNLKVLSISFWLTFGVGDPPFFVTQQQVRRLKGVSLPQIGLQDVSINENE